MRCGRLWVWPECGIGYNARQRHSVPHPRAEYTPRKAREAQGVDRTRRLGREILLHVRQVLRPETCLVGLGRSPVSTTWTLSSEAQHHRKPDWSNQSPDDIRASPTPMPPSTKPCSALALLWRDLRMGRGYQRGQHPCQGTSAHPAPLVKTEHAKVVLGGTAKFTLSRGRSFPIRPGG